MKVRQAPTFERRTCSSAKIIRDNNVHGDSYLNHSAVLLNGKHGVQLSQLQLMISVKSNSNSDLHCDNCVARTVFVLAETSQRNIQGEAFLTPIHHKIPLSSKPAALASFI